MRRLLLTAFICISILFICTTDSGSVLGSWDTPSNKAGKHFCLPGDHVLARKVRCKTIKIIN